MKLLTEGCGDWQANLPFVEFNGAVVVTIVAGGHHNCVLLVRPLVMAMRNFPDFLIIV